MKRVAASLIAALALCVFLLAGCDAVDSVRNGFAHSQAVSARLEKSLGMKSFVGFNWNNGVLTAVTVSFEGLPNGRPLPEIAEAARKAVLEEFKQAPRQITIAFTLVQ